MQFWWNTFAVPLEQENQITELHFGRFQPLDFRYMWDGVYSVRHVSALNDSYPRVEEVRAIKFAGQ